MREFETLSLDMSKYPRGGGGDLLHTFLSSSDPTTDHHFLRRHNHNQQGFGGGISISERLLEEEQELELNLGLSLGGRFGVDKDRKGLVRSSSIAGTMPLIRDEDTLGGAVTTAPPQADRITSLARTTSLPTETEEEWRRRKEIQTLRRMEAKRRRSEKQKVLKDCTVNVGEDHRGAGVGVVSPVGATATAAGESGISLNFRGKLEREQQHMLGLPNNFNNPNHLPSTTISTTSSMVDLGLAGQWSVAAGGGGGKEIDPAGGGGIKAQRGFFSSLHGLLARQQHQQPQQGSDPASGVESQGGCGSSAAADTSNPESRTHQGGSHAKIPARTQSLPLEQGSSQETSPSSASRTSQRQQPPENNNNQHKRKESGGVEDMPCVFTIGDGPNGRKVEGILYKYGKGEEVRIMCVCHGSFFSPAEFVKHAGGRDVDHPLRHIVVNPS